jgi:uncharacterized protein YdeI (YjbR/CyaY-like superfamily)
MHKPDQYPILSFNNQQSWEAWLGEHHAESKGVWLKLAKKDSAIASVSYAEALESALCYGWIDGQKSAYDDQSWLQKFTPRGPKSIWSQNNCDKAKALLASGRMLPAGIQLMPHKAPSPSLPISRRNWTSCQRPTSSSRH